jgi:D-alanyl-D-alanine endopeptidase (penicillin-binding protein 7)
LLLALPAGHALAAGSPSHSKHAVARPVATGKTNTAKVTAKTAKPAKVAVHGKPAAKKHGNARVAAFPARGHKRQHAALAARQAPRAGGGKLERSRYEPPAIYASAARAPLEHLEEGASSRAAPGDPVLLRSGAALVIDQDTGQTLLAKNDHAVQPIASLTKLMTGLIISDAALPMDAAIAITQDDVDTEKGSRSRLGVGATLTRGELLHLALMSSENRAAHALGRTYPGGMNRFVALMNARAIMLGMKDTHYVEPTGLSSGNRSSAADLAILVAAAHEDPLLRQLSTTANYEVAAGERLLQYKNTNRLVRDPQWAIGLQKTGYISEAGHCLVMQARIAGRKLIMVFLDSSGKSSRIADAKRVRRWLESQPVTGSASAKAAPHTDAG